MKSVNFPIIFIARIITILNTGKKYHTDTTVVKTCAKCSQEFRTNKLRRHLSSFHTPKTNQIDTQLRKAKPKQISSTLISFVFLTRMFKTYLLF